MFQVSAWKKLGLIGRINILFFQNILYRVMEIVSNLLIKEPCSVIPESIDYCSDPKFSDRQVCANSKEPNQIAASLLCLPFRLHIFGCYTLW